MNEAEIDGLVDRLEGRNKVWKGMNWMFLANGMIMLLLASQTAHRVLKDVWSVLRKVGGSQVTVDVDVIGLVPSWSAVALVIALVGVGLINVTLSLIVWRTRAVDEVIVYIWRQKKTQRIGDGT